MRKTTVDPRVPAHITPSLHIEGVYFAPIRIFSDSRGRFMETFRRDWFPWIAWDRLQTNRSESRAGVLRGLHYHHHQIDYWVAMQGTLRVGMIDLRPGSPTYRATEVVEIGEANMTGVFIPVGVAHGFYAVTDCVLTYMVNNYYDGRDENGVAWDDPDLGVPWGVDAPLLSDRDLANPRYADIPAENRPAPV
jgi:dTDP-4-dehydrorhamnose 3,5-epimerase